MKAYNKKRKPKHTTEPRWSEYTARGNRCRKPRLTCRVAGSYSKTYWTTDSNEAGDIVRVKKTFSKNGYKSKARKVLTW